MVTRPDLAPAAAWLDGYAAEASRGDLFGDASRPVANVWRRVAAGLAAATDGDPSAIQDATARHAADLGLAFRLTGDEDERAWPLGAMPLIVGAQEWAQVERGLIQRAQLMETVAADIYGEQKLVTGGHLPAAVVAGSPFFARRMIGRTPQGGGGAGAASSMSMPPTLRAGRAGSGGCCRTACGWRAASAMRWRIGWRCRARSAICWPMPMRAACRTSSRRWERAWPPPAAARTRASR